MYFLYTIFLPENVSFTELRISGELRHGHFIKIQEILHLGQKAKALIDGQVNLLFVLITVLRLQYEMERGEGRGRLVKIGIVFVITYILKL